MSVWKQMGPIIQAAIVARFKERMSEIEKKEVVNHPAHYGGDTVYEVIKVIEAWGLDKNFDLGNAIKYIARAEKKGAMLEDLKKAAWYLDREIKKLEKK